MSNIYLTDLQLAERYGVRRATIWEWSRRGQFPKPLKLSPATTRWHFDEVMAHEQSIAEGRAQ